MSRCGENAILSETADTVKDRRQDRSHIDGASIEGYSEETMTIPLLLHGKHAGPTVAYEPFGPWIVPWRFATFEPEYQALRTGVGLIDYSTQAVIEVQGADRVSFLHQLLTNDIKGLAPGSGCRAALVTATAKLVADLLVLTHPESLWLLCELPRAEAIVKTLEQHRFSEQVTLVNHERRYGVLALEGPRTIALLTQLLGAVVSLPATGDHAAHQLQTIPIRCVRHSLTGGIGVLLLVEAEAMETVWALLQQQGRPFGLSLAGWEALNAARLEAGVPWFGIDMDESNLLPETGLERTAVSDSKGCYLGQEIIARMQTYGSANKKLMGLKVEGASIPERGAQIYRAAEEVGAVTSSGFSPILQQPLAMGYVKRSAYDAGTAVEIRQNGARLSAVVAALPIAPSGERTATPASSGRTRAGGKA